MVEGLYCPDEFRPAPSTMASFADSSQFPWMDVAMDEIGERERRGARSNPRIMEYLHSAAGWVSEDETHWCAAFVNWVMGQVGIEGTGRLNARSWQTWGQTIPNDAPQYGAIAVLWRVSRRSAKGHVGFYCGEEGGQMILLGGNQSNRVRLKAYPRSHLLTFRWPPHFPAPNMSVMA